MGIVNISALYQFWIDCKKKISDTDKVADISEKKCHISTVDKIYLTYYCPIKCKSWNYLAIESI